MYCYTTPVFHYCCCGMVVLSCWTSSSPFTTRWHAWRLDAVSPAWRCTARGRLPACLLRVAHILPGRCSACPVARRPSCFSCRGKANSGNRYPFSAFLLFPAVAVQAPCSYLGGGRPVYLSFVPLVPPCAASICLRDAVVNDYRLPACRCRVGAAVLYLHSRLPSQDAGV